MDLDFSKLKYNISLLSDGQKVFDLFPQLRDYEEFNQNVDDDLLKWVMLYVDDGSPFFKMFNADFEEKGLAIYRHLGLNNTDLLNYINGEKIDRQFRIRVEAMIFKFFILIDKHNYNTWYSKWSFVQQLNAFMRIQIDPTDDKYEAKTATKSKTSATLVTEQEQLAKYETLVFGDSKIKGIVTEQVAKMVTYPEKLALEYPLRG